VPGKAYLNRGFLRSKAARPIRILSEYFEPLSRFQYLDVRDTIVIFGSARARPPAELDPARGGERKESRRVSRGSERWRKDEPPDRELTRYYRDAYDLSRLLSRWAKGFGQGNRFVVCSGGGPGIMEAANRGAMEGAGAPSIGLTISLPTEEKPNPYITPDLCFEFHYFFMRKLWFLYLAAALVVFPGGFGTMDELFEVLTLRQTRKLSRPLPIVLYGSEFWKEALNFDALVRWGTIGQEDLRLFRVCDSPQEAFEYLRKELLRHYRRPVGRRAIEEIGGMP